MVTFPERLYPFTETTAGGKKLTGELAYAYVAEENKIKFGDVYSLQSPKLLIWREVFHFSASVFFVFIADQMFRHMSFFNGLFLLVFVVVMVAVQEFYLHPHYYDQKPLKGMIDFMVWMFPIVIYILI
ncbi:MAG: hypothetical protein QG654_291 [Patescibacteria group bacterium]|nr:hypothetical protein [Patescibacteria group bacterium]